MVWIRIRIDVLLVLIWVQTICNGYQQMTKVAASKERVNINQIFVRLFAPITQSLHML